MWILEHLENIADEYYKNNAEAKKRFIEAVKSALKDLNN